MIGATILTIAYGIKISSTDDPLIALAEAANHSVSQAAVLPITSLMDIFPVLKYIPKWFPGMCSISEVNLTLKCVSKVDHLNIRPNTGQALLTICMKSLMPRLSELW